MAAAANRVRSPYGFSFIFISHMSGGSVPSSTGGLLEFVGFRQPVIIRQVSFSLASSFFAWVERSHTGLAYSAAQ